MRHYGDITKLSGYELPIVDCITGGSPCQDLSVAGLRAGLAGERSGLFMEQIRIVKEMRDADRATGRTGLYVRPRFMVWENVPGSFSSNKGKDFQAVLTEIVRIIEPDSPDVPMPEKGKWPKSGCLYDDMGGWSVAWRVHDAQFWGVPQRRKRIAVVADFGGLTAPEVLFERKGMSRYFESCREEGEESAGRIKDSADDPVKCYDFDNERRRGPDEFENVSPAITARAGTGGNNVPAITRTLNNQMVFENHSQDTRYRLLGEVSQPVSATFGMGGNNQPLVVKESDDTKPLGCADKEPLLLESNQKNATVQQGISTALPAAMGMGVGYVPMVMEQSHSRNRAISFQERAGKPGGVKEC